MLFIESHCGNKKITISGGEPLEQANSLEILIHRLKGKGYNVCMCLYRMGDRMGDRKGT